MSRWLFQDIYVPILSVFCELSIELDKWADYVILTAIYKVSLTFNPKVTNISMSVIGDVIIRKLTATIHTKHHNTYRTVGKKGINNKVAKVYK